MKFEDFLGNKMAIATCRRFIGAGCGCLVIYGGVGNGKTSLAKLISEHFDAIWVDQKVSKEFLKNVANAAKRQSVFTSKKRTLVIDDYEAGYMSQSDLKYAVANFSHLLPIIVTATDKRALLINNATATINLLPLSKGPKGDFHTLLLKRCRELKLDLSPENVKFIHANCGNDIRRMYEHLKFLILNRQDKEIVTHSTDAKIPAEVHRNCVLACKLLKIQKRYTPFPESYDSFNLADNVKVDTLRSAGVIQDIGIQIEKDLNKWDNVTDTLSVSDTMVWTNASEMGVELISHCFPAQEDAHRIQTNDTKKLPEIFYKGRVSHCDTEFKEFNQNKSLKILLENKSMAELGAIFPLKTEEKIQKLASSIGIKPSRDEVNKRIKITSS